MAAPEEGGAEAPPPPPPATDEPPGDAAAAACGAPCGEAPARGARSAAVREEEDDGGAVDPAASPPPAEGPELLAVTEELAQSLAALGAGAATATGTVLYLQADGSLLEGAGLGAEEQRRLLEQLLGAADSPHPITAEPPPAPPRHAAAPLAPGELQRVIEAVSKARERQKAAPEEPCPRPPPSRVVGCPLPPQTCGAAPPLAGTVHNAAQQLQSVARQLALRQGKAMAASRLLPHKQLEAMCVQVQPGQLKETERPMPSLAPILPRTVPLSPALGRSSGIPGPGIANPQLVRMQPVAAAERQQLVLHSSPEPPAEALVPPRGSVPVAETPTSEMLNGQRAARGPGPAAGAPGVATGALVPSLEKHPRDEKLKRSLKVQTRSGRISRPPTYKARDYKFIKMEDLADGHQSDSDDYSELSIEDDEEGKVKGKDVLFSSSSYNLKPKTFKCQTCEKSYIGKGGLARHYKLNPGHGQLEPPPQKMPVNKPNGSLFVDSARGGREELRSPAHLNSTAATLSHENALAADGKAGEQTCRAAGSRVQLAEQKDSSSGQRAPRAPRGPGRPRRPRSCGRARLGGRARCSGRLGRPGQPPAKPLSSVPAEHSVFRRKARLKELIQQCDNEELMELALPRLAKLVTVFEFLLMKVEKGYPAKACFPDVYREFEDLHNMVKKMAYDHLGNSDLLSCQQPVEIKDAKVAESLGITAVLPGEGEMQGVESCSQCVTKMVSEQVPVEILGQKRLAESSGEELLPSAKRTKLEDLMENVDDAYASQEELKEKSGDLCALFERDGFNPLNGEILLSVDRDTTCCTAGSTLPTAEQHHPLADPGVGADAEHSGTFSPSVEMRTEYSQPVDIQGPGRAGAVSLLQAEVVLPVEASPELVQAAFVGESKAGGPAGAVQEEPRSHQSTGSAPNPTSQEEKSHFAASEQLHHASVTHELQELEKVFSTDMVPISYPHGAGSDRSPAQGASLAAAGNHETPFPFCAAQGHPQLDSTAGEAVAFEIAEESHGFLSQGQEQILIQTSDGLLLSRAEPALLSEAEPALLSRAEPALLSEAEPALLSRAEPALLSQAEGIVILTDGSGTTMQIRTPQGLALQTVQALLAMGAAGPAEGLLQGELEP